MAIIGASWSTEPNAHGPQADNKNKMDQLERRPPCCHTLIHWPSFTSVTLANSSGNCSAPKVWIGTSLLRLAFALDPEQ